MLVVRGNGAIHQPTARAVRSRSALGRLWWLLRGRNLSYRSAATAALLSPAAGGFLSGAAPRSLRAADRPKAPPDSPL
jgi:hypothetical protein